jgi:hypothetical protein
VATDEELAHLKDLELAWREARRALDAKMTEHYPERGRRRRKITDDEANAEIEQYGDRFLEAEAALLKASRELLG